jgi:hypothetical protein
MGPLASLMSEDQSSPVIIDLINNIVIGRVVNDGTS